MKKIILLFSFIFFTGKVIFPQAENHSDSIATYIFKSGTSNYFKGNYKNAISDLKFIADKYEGTSKLDSVGSDFGAAYYFLALCYEGINDYNNALHYWKRDFSRKGTKEGKYGVLMNNEILKNERQGWKVILNDENMPLSSKGILFFYKPSTMKKSKGKVTVWEKRVVIPDAPPESSKEYGNWMDETTSETLGKLINSKFSNMVGYIEYDCNLEMYRMLEVIQYNETGEANPNQHISEKEPQWERIIPDTVIEGIFRTYCK